MKTSKLEFAGLETANCSEEVSGRHQSCLAFLQKRLGLGERIASVSPGLLPFTSPSGLSTSPISPSILFLSFTHVPYPIQQQPCQTAPSTYTLNVAIFYHLHRCHLYPSQYYLPSGPQKNLLTDTSILYSPVHNLFCPQQNCLFVFFLAAFDPDIF